MKKELTQEVFKNQPSEVDWCGVDYDGRLNFGTTTENPRYTWGSERWRGFKQVGESVINTDYKTLSSLRRHIALDIVGELIVNNNDDKLYRIYRCTEHGIQAHRINDNKDIGICSYCKKHMSVYIKTYADRLRIAINNNVVNKCSLLEALKISPKELNKLLKYNSFSKEQELLISIFFSIKQS